MSIAIANDNKLSLIHELGKDFEQRASKHDEEGSFVINILSLKTNVADAAIAIVKQAVEAIGGQSFYQSKGLERLFRDVPYIHPLPKWDQYAFTGSKLLVYK